MEDTGGVKKLSGLWKNDLAMEMQQAAQRALEFNGYEFKLKHVKHGCFISSHIHLPSSRYKVRKGLDLICV